MKEIYAIYQCSREDFIMAAKKGVKLSFMPFVVCTFVVFCVTKKEDAFKECIKWNLGEGKRMLSINWFVKTALYS